jgi:arginase
MNVELILVPWDSGARGVRMGAGPERLLDLGLVDRLEAGGHSVSTIVLEVAEGPLQAEVATAFALNRMLAVRVREATHAGRLPVVLAGNCISALGAVAGLDGATGVFWFDAHGDFNTPETTTGGFLDGMAVAILAGRCWRRLARSVPGFAPVPEEDIVLVGTRDLDEPERALLDESEVNVLGPTDLAERLPELADEIGGRVRQSYLHLDLDVMDPADGRANHFAAEDGVPLAELLERVADLVGRAPPGAVTLSAYEPAADGDGRAGEAAIRLLEAVLGAADG